MNLSSTTTSTSSRRPKWLLAVDLLLFKISWVLLVVLQGRAIPVVVCLLLLRLALAENRARLCRDAGMVFVAGLAMDTLLAVTGLYLFPEAVLPLWLVLLWLSFAMTLPHGSRFLQGQHPLVLAFAGAVTGMLSYFAGYLLNGVAFGLPLPQALALIGVAWGLYVPVVIFLLQQLPEARADL